MPFLRASGIAFACLSVCAVGLLRDGFIMRDGTGWSFYAPDAWVLLRMPLLRERAPAGHVFGRRPGTIIAGLIEEGGEVVEVTDLPDRPAPPAPRR